jgi:hypothetical protein
MTERPVGNRRFHPRRRHVRQLEADHVRLDGWNGFNAAVATNGKPS